MQLQAVSSVAATCRSRTCPIDSGRPYQGFSNVAPSHQPDKANRHCCTHHLRPGVSRFPFRHRLHSTGLHYPNPNPTATPRIQRNVSVKAVEADSFKRDESSSQNLSFSHRFASISPGDAAPTGSNSSESIGLPNKNGVAAEAHDSFAVMSNKVTAPFTNLKNWWISIHETYREDLATWGFGTSPIFTVFLGPSGKVEKVSIDEDEIQRRQVGDGLLPPAELSKNKQTAQQKLKLARRIAQDLELEKRGLNRYSTVISVVQHPSVFENMSSGKKFLRQIDTSVRTVSPILSCALMIAIPLYGIFMSMKAHDESTGKADPKISNKETSAARLEKMKNLKARISGHKGNTNTEQPPLAPSELMQKILEVREMARKVRATEIVQKSVEDSDMNIEDYESKLSGPPAAMMSAAGANIKAEPGEDLSNKIDNYQQGAQMLLDNTGREGDQVSSQDVQMPKSSINVIQKPFQKVKPRVTSSSDEAMDIVRNKESNNSEINGRALCDGESQVVQKAHNSSKENAETFRSNHLDKHLEQSKICDDETENILDIDSAGQIGKNKCEVLHKIDNYQQGAQILLDTTGREGDQVSSQDMQMTNSSMNAIQKPFQKKKPRIISSLDEAMDILGNKESHNSEINGWLLYDGKSQVVQKSHNAETLGSNHSDKHLEQSKMYDDETENILDIDSAGQVGENKCEVLHEDYNSRVDQAYTETVHDTGVKRQATEVETLKLKLKDVSDNGHLDERQLPFTNGDDKRRQFTPKIQDSAEVLSAACSRDVTKQDAVSGSALSMEPDEIVGSGQPFQLRAERGRHGAIFSHTKRWSKELQRKYDLERDPEIRGLMREIGSELDSWVTEDEIEETDRLAKKIAEGDEEYLQNKYRKARNKMKEEKERFGLDAVLQKYKEYQPKGADELWWLDIHCVLCLMITNKDGEGLYGLDMTIDEHRETSQVARHVIGFEERKDALNFCRFMELKAGSKFATADILPFSPKKLLQFAKQEGFQVTVLRSGQIRTHVDQTLEEVEEHILEIGRSVYWDKMDREHSIDIDSILHQRFGL